MGKPVDIPSEVSKMAGGPLILVDRGDGHQFKIREGQLAEFRRRHPRAFRLGATKVAPPAPRRELTSGAAGLEELTIPQLREIAERQGVTVPAGPKRAIIQALAEGSA